jgi:hypothetical protein
MSNQLLLPNGTTHKLLANIILIRNLKKNDGQEKPDFERKQERKLPLFYTKPIFKANSHGLL